MAKDTILIIALLAGAGAAFLVFAAVLAAVVDRTNGDS